MQPRIETLKLTTLVGMRMHMSFADNATRVLWQSFMPRRMEIKNVGSDELYSVEVYHNPRFFESFDPNAMFEKWAAVEVMDANAVPSEMEILVLPEGLYAVFMYKGPGSDGAVFYQYIFGTWLPASAYRLDNRPHFALMGAKYKNDDPNSEEEIWIPIRLRS